MPTALKPFLLFVAMLTAAPLAFASGSEVKAKEYVASGWQASVFDYANAPAFMIAVDKKDQQVRVFERKSPLTKIAEYTCTTGQSHGDKLVEGDQKTPEGVYFVVNHIKSGLNYTLYGYEAYPLNYPNPVDRLRKKTGSGIWIHGKGIPLVPYDSNGCVGMNNQDIAAFKARTLIGQPVTMAVDVAELTPQEAAAKAGTVELLVNRVHEWANAWSSRSPEMFNFYNPAAYSLAQGQSFNGFKAQKESLFKVLPWINTTVSDVQVLEGPGYWVTWFNQNYEAPNLKTWGTRRLYWQEDQNGELRIVGMEWLKNFKSPVLYADAGSKTNSSVTDAGTSASAGSATAATGKTGATGTTTANNTTANTQPANTGTTVVADNTKKATTTTGTATGTELTNAEKLKREAQAVEDMLVKEGQAFIKNWHKAWQNRDLAAYARCYTEKAVQGNRKGKNWITAQKKDLWARTEIVKLEFTNLKIETTNSGLKATMLQRYKDSTGYSDYGRKILHLEYDKSWQIVREDWEAVN